MIGLGGWREGGPMGNRYRINIYPTNRYRWNMKGKERYAERGKVVGSLGGIIRCGAVLS